MQSLAVQHPQEPLIVPPRSLVRFLPLCDALWLLAIVVSAGVFLVLRRHAGRPSLNKPCFDAVIGVLRRDQHAGRLTAGLHLTARSDYWDCSASSRRLRRWRC